MAEIFATVTGVVSLVDVALRACSALYDSIEYLKDAPDLSQRLQRTVQSIESVLRSLNLFIAQYRQSITPAGQPDQLPDAVGHELIAIKDTLDALATLLPAKGSGSKLRRGIKTILDRKKVVEVIQRLDSHQITLILALQSFAQQYGIKLHEDLLYSLEEAKRQRQDLKGELGSISAGLHNKLDSITQTSTQALLAQEKSNTAFEGLPGLISAAHDTLNDKLDAVQFSLAEMKLRGNHVRSSTILTAPTEDVLARIFRAELRRVIMPTVQQCFDTYKSNSDGRLDEIKRSIDEMTQQLGSKATADARDYCSTISQISPEIVDGSAQTDQDLTSVTTAGSRTEHRNEANVRSVKYRRRSWVFRWAIGKLWVTLSTSVAKRTTSPVYREGKTLVSQEAYRVTIEFQPAQSLILMRGLSMSVASTPDQRGYSQICPLLSTFAVVPFYAEVMDFAESNNVEGLQDLFARRLAAPSDRDERGRTPLMQAAESGASDACRLLLREGADPLALDRWGKISFDFANQGFWYDVREASEIDRSVIESRYIEVVQLLHQAESDIVEYCSTSSLIGVGLYLEASILQKGNQERLMTKELLYLQRLKEYGLKFGYEIFDGANYVFGEIVSSGDQVSAEMIGRKLQILLDLGLDVCATDYLGVPVLHWIFMETRNEAYSHNMIEVATAFLQNGADPCALDEDGNSSFDMAEYFGWTAEWSEVLERAGYDADEVEKETRRRKWLFHHPGDAYVHGRSGIDEDEVTPPSGKGLVRRRAGAGDRLEE